MATAEWLLFMWRLNAMPELTARERYMSGVKYKDRKKPRWRR